MGQPTGKETEAYVWMRLLQHGLTPYLPVIDNQGADALIQASPGKFARLQIKSRGFPLPESEPYGEQIKNLWWAKDELAFDFLVIVLPKQSLEDFEAWVVPSREVVAKLSPRGDLTMSVNLLRAEWREYYEAWESL